MSFINTQFIGSVSAPAMQLPACVCLLLLGAAVSSASPQHSGDTSRSSQERQIRFPDGLSFALEPKIAWNLWHTEEEGKMHLQSRMEFKYTPPTGATGRQARQLMERASIFSSMRAAFAQFGLDGAACLQRAVCETAAAPRHSDGLLGDLVTLALSPSREQVTSGPTAAQLAPLLEAEMVGRWDGGASGCKVYYERCPVSLFNMKSGAADFTSALLDFVKAGAPALS